MRQGGAETSGGPTGPRAEQVAGRQWLVGEPRVSRLNGGAVRVVAPAKINLYLPETARSRPMEDLAAFVRQAYRML